MAAVSRRWSAEGLLGRDPTCFEVVERILRVGRAFERKAEALCLEHGISYAAFTVLAALRNVGEPYELTPTELYRHVMITSGGMTKRLIQLENEALIDRMRAGDDKRSVRVRLTRRGKRLVEAVLPRYLLLASEIVGQLPRPERKDLALALQSLLVALTDDR